MTEEKNLAQTLIDKIIEHGNLGALPEAEESIFREKMESQINERIGLIIFDNLDDEGTKIYEELIDSGDVKDPKKMQDLLENHMPEYEKKIKEGLDKFIGEIILASQR